MFLNREKEIGALWKRMRAKGAQLVIVYGRRRVGKTELIRRAVEGARHVYYVADQTSHDAQLQDYSRLFREAVGSSDLQGITFPSWEVALRLAFREAESKRLVVVLDEFPYLCQSDPSLPSVLQKIWDERAKKSKLVLILCGSFVSFMQDLLSQKNPLSGRRTAEFRIEPMDYRGASLFVPRYGPVDRAMTYGMLGGTPAYLEQFDAALPLWKNVEERILDKTCFLYHEARYSLMQQLREPGLYFAILRAIAEGSTSPNEIAQHAHVEAPKLGRYLSILREMGLVDREVPLTEKAPHKSRKGLYKLRDPYPRFWFRFISPMWSHLETVDTKYVLKKISSAIDVYMGSAFEDICQQMLRFRNLAGGLPVTIGRVGRWWDSGREIDIVAEVDDGTLLIGECKWSRKAVGTNVLRNLDEGAQALSELGHSVGLRCLFSKSGFTKSLRAVRRDDLLLFDLSSDFY